MKSKNKRVKRRGRYAPSLKREIARRYLEGEFSYAVAAEEYGLANGGVVKEFVKWYRRQKDYLGGQKQPPMKEDTKSGRMGESELVARLRAELAAAERTAYLAERKADLFHTMLKNAGELVGEDLEKKFAAAASKK